MGRAGRCLFFTETATTAIYTLSLHDALPISVGRERHVRRERPAPAGCALFRRNRRLCLRPRCAARHHGGLPVGGDRKSTRLNSSHMSISYAVFCLKKKRVCHG